MAEKTVAVKLTARIDAYQKAMRDAKKSTSDFASGSMKSTEKLGRQMQKVGKTMSRNVTLPLLGIGVASVKLANDFDKSMSKIVGLVGISTEEVDGMKDAVLGLAGETARSPQELADALFVVTSAGVRGEEALSTLEMAARASAAGLGETADIARAVAGAINAYGPDVLDAAHATDVLTATARAGNFETSQLAGALGQVLPFAKQAQVGFEDVGGAVALLTRTNGDAALSVTQVNGLLRAFVTPTQQARTVLDELGLSAEDVRNHLGENGLVATLQMLDGRLDGNREKLGQLIGRAEGTSAAYQILDADAATLAETFGVTANATGMVGEAFGAVSETDAHKMQQAMTDLMVAGIKIGAIIGPIVADLAGGVASLASAFTDLDPTLQKVILGVAAAAAAAGPLLIVTGSLIKNYALLKTAVAGSNLTMAGAAGASKTLAAQLGLAYLAIGFTHTAVKGLRGETEWLYDDVSALQKPFQWLARDAFELGGGVKSASAVWTEFEKEAEGAFASMTSGVYTMEQLRERLDESSLSMQARNLITIAFREQLDAQAEAEANLAEATAETTKATDELTVAAEDAAAAQEELEAETRSAEESAARMEAQAEASARAMDEWSEFTDKLTASHERMIDEVLGSLSGMFDYEQAVLNLDNAYSGYQTAVEEATAVLADSESTDRQKAEAIRGLRLDELALAEQTYETAAAHAEEQGALEGSAEWAEIMRGKLEQQADAYPELREEIDMLIDGLNRIPRNISSSVDITTYYRQVGSSTEPVQPTGGRRALGGPTYPNTMHEVNENGSELFTENGRTYLMSSTQGFVTPLPATPGGSSGAADGGTRIGVNVEKLIDQSGHSLDDVFRVANAHLAMGV